jgi:uncharacterized protein (TIGR03437 family)
MSKFTSVKSLSLVLLSFLFAGVSAPAQTTSLSLGSGTAPQGNSVSLNLSLSTSGGSAPSGLQWALNYPSGSVGPLTIAPGPVLAAAGKNVTCNASGGTVTCVAVGMNATAIASGSVATVTVGLGSAAGGSTVPISVNGVLGTLPNGTAMAVAETGGTITVLALAPVITSAATAGGTVGSAFSYQIVASNSPASFAATGLPAGLSINTATGLLSGTPSAAGTATVTLGATNGGGTGNATLTLTVQPPAPVITSAATASGAVGSAFSYQIVASNSPASYTATGLNAGLSVNASSGLLSGTPSAAGTAAVTLGATNGGGTGSATLTLTIQPAAPVITSSVTAGGTVGSAFSYQIGASNSPASYTATGLPAGLSVNASSGLLSGTPSSAGIATVTLGATNGGGTGSATLTLTIQPAAPVITSSVTASGTVGSAFSYQIGASNSPASYTATGLPAGLSVNTSSGLVSGTPSAAGTSKVKLDATNSAGNGSATLTLTIQRAAPAITSAVTASGTVGSSFSYRIAASNSPTSYAATGLPAGLAVNTTSGLLSGTPSAAGIATVTIGATNGGGTGSATLTLTVQPAAPVITSSVTAGGTVGSAFSYQIVASNSPASYAATGLPAGLAVNATTGLLSGTPTAAGTSKVKLEATNGGGTGKETVTLTIAKKGDAIPQTSKGIGPSEVQPQNTVTGLSCTPRIITAGSQATCELRVAFTSAATQIQVTSSSGQVQAPSAVLTRASQTHLTFQVTVDAAAKEQVATIRATAGTAAEDTIQVKASSGPLLTVPDTQAARLGKSLDFAVTAVDPNGLPVQLTASQVPMGAAFDAASGLFKWIPSASQSGKYKIAFGATDSAGRPSSAEVKVNVTSGVPSVASAERLLCSPGALASLNGSGFAESSSALSDPSGQSMVLGDTRVRVNGRYVPVVAASDARVTFLCPALEPDTQLEATVETDAGSSEPLGAAMQEATPVVFSLDGSGQNQGVVSFAETTDLAMARNFRVSGHPAQSGDEILIWCSGLGVTSQVPTGAVLVEVGGVDAEVESVRAVPGRADVYTIQARVPRVMDFGDAVPVQVRVNTLSGKQFNSNQVTMVVEPVSQ